MENQRHGKIVRGFSMVDPEMVSKLHTDIKSRGEEKHEMARCNFTLPDLGRFDEEFVAFLMKDLVENSTLRALEGSGHLNWWTKVSGLQRLYPLLTSGDGNCLLHAASLGIWGVHDRCLNLRQDVYYILSSSLHEKSLKYRWMWYEWVKNLQEGLVWSADEWESEWKTVLNMADATPRLPQQSLCSVPEGNVLDSEDTVLKENSFQPRYESLEEIHICSLAHVLRRPIIVISDNWVYDLQGNPMSPIPFAGVYLPVECNPSDCCRIPLVLAYSSSHFSPVVSTEPTDKPKEGNSDKDISPMDEKQNTTSDKNSGAVCNKASKEATKSSDVANKPSAIHAAVSSIIEVTKSTILQHFSPTSTTPLSTKNSVEAAIPLVDKDLKILPLPFATDPGPNWDNLNNENHEEIIKEKCLSDEQRMSLLRKYIDVVEVEISAESFGKNKQSTGQDNANNCETDDNQTNASNNTQNNEVIKVPVAVLPCDNQPSFYKETIEGYLEKAKERYDFEKETKIVEPKPTPSVRCANDGCDLYGTVENNYLCTKCFQVQTKSIVKYQGPPPSYSQVVGNENVFYPPRFAGKSVNTENTTTLKELSEQCKALGCTFYGTSDKDGFCSKCYSGNKK